MTGDDKTGDDRTGDNMTGDDRTLYKQRTALVPAT